MLSWVNISKFCVKNSNMVVIQYITIVPWRNMTAGRITHLQTGVGNSLHWRHNERDVVSKHRGLDCLLTRLFRRRSKKTSKLRVTDLCRGNSPWPVNFPHKGPVTRKMFPFDDAIMDVLDLAILTFRVTVVDVISYRGVCHWSWRRLNQEPGDSLCPWVCLMTNVPRRPGHRDDLGNHETPQQPGGLVGYWRFS